MKLKDQCVSYELAKQMKMLGVKQNGIFTWIVASKDGETDTSPLIQLRHGIETYDDTEVHDGWRLNGWSAFTVAELINMFRDCWSHDIMIPSNVHVADFLGEKLIGLYETRSKEN